MGRIAFVNFVCLKCSFANNSLLSVGEALESCDDRNSV